MVIWAGLSYIHFLFPADTLPVSLPHAAFDAAAWQAYLAAYIALAFYTAAYVALWRKRGPFLTLYVLGALFRLGVFVYHTFMPNFPSLTGFAVLAIDSAVIIVAASGPVFSTNEKDRS